jgi:hypothetical protein
VMMGGGGGGSGGDGGGGGVMAAALKIGQSTEGWAVRQGELAGRAEQPVGGASGIGAVKGQGNGRQGRTQGRRGGGTSNPMMTAYELKRKLLRYIHVVAGASPCHRSAFKVLRDGAQTRHWTPRTVSASSSATSTAPK